MESKRKGLSSAEVLVLQEKYGPNLLPEKAPTSWWKLLLSQLKNPLVYVLLSAALITFFLEEYADSLIILLAVMINTALGFIQEQKASQALHALKHHLSMHSLVIRDGLRQEVDSSTLVPGDLVILNQGAKIPADGQLLFANRFHVNEAEMTGEMAAVLKSEAELVMMGTTVSAGQALMQVEAIGRATKLADIALSIQTAEETTVLQKQLKNFSQKLVKIIIFLVFLTFILGLIRGSNPVAIFTTAVALAVSSIPEGLLVSMTVILAIAMQRILRKKGLVKRLMAAETLGGVTVICCDKTGTLTLGEMQVVKVIGKEKKMAEQLILANDLDDPMLLAAYDWAKKIVSDKNQHFERIDSLPFSPKDKFFASLNNFSNEQNLLMVNGAPEVILEWSNLNKQEKEVVLGQINQLSEKGMRVIACAQKQVDKSNKKLSHKLVKNSLDWLGLVAFADPVRENVAKTLDRAERAGIRIIVITGDYLATTQHVLAELKRPVSAEEAITGEQLLKMNQEELSQKIAKLTVFARSTPDQKLKIVNALKANGEVVAMMGDGVNDAPALHRADIGIVVAEATEVAKESADLVLLDSNFSTVIAAIKEGRVAFENVRKVIIYLLNDAFGEILLVTLSIILHIPLPITAVQILWINLVSDGLPDLALTVDPESKNLMLEKPRSAKEPLVNRAMVRMIVIVSLLSGLTSLLFFVITYNLTGDLIMARSAAFASLGFDSLLYVFAVRNIHQPFWQINLFANKWLNYAVLAGLIMQLLPFALPSLRVFFGIEMLSPTLWLIAVANAILLFLAVEVFKWFVFEKHSKK